MGFSLPYQSVVRAPVCPTTWVEGWNFAALDPRRTPAQSDGQRSCRVSRGAGVCLRLRRWVGSRGPAAGWDGSTVRSDGYSELDALAVGQPAVLMLSISPATRIFVALEPADLRQSFNGLQGRVQSVLQQDPLAGHLFECPLDCTHRRSKRNPASTDHAPFSSSERQAI
jgi:IS66 Orf2 like protein